MIKLIILGSGTGVPSLERSSPGYFLSTREHRYLVDCGSGSLRQLMRAGETCQTVDGVFITHTHPDHIGDLIPLIHALKVTPDFRRAAPLRLFGPPGFGRYFEQCVVPVASRPKHFVIEVEEVCDTFKLGTLTVSTSPTRHSEQVNSVAYRFNQNNASLVLSGDCDYDDGIVQLASHAHTLLIDCSFPDALKIPGHLSAGECGQIAAQAKVKNLVLSHLYPVPAEHDSRVAEARAACSADVRLAEDLMVIECA